MKVLPAKRRLLAPEIVQTSMTDCGPASLKCLLEGFGIQASYGRLREACQTDVDGSSIDTMEEVAKQLGLAAEQIMLPEDHLFLPQANACPAILVIRLPIGLTHFVVIWRYYGSWVQVMDPAVGRRWMKIEELRRRLYRHTMVVPATAWREWAGSEEFLTALRQRLANLGINTSTASVLIENGLTDKSWRGMAALDAATRMSDSLVRVGGLRRRKEASGVLEMLVAKCRTEEVTKSEAISSRFWSVRPAPPDDEGVEQLYLTGVVLVRVRGVNVRDTESDESDVTQPLAPEIAAALSERQRHPALELLRFLREDGVLGPLIVAITSILAASGVLIEALLFRGLFDLSRKLGLTEQRLGAVLAMLIFTLALCLLKWPFTSSLLRAGRKLEARLRLAFLQKIPKIGDRYFQSRPTSDMAERGHLVHSLRQLPLLGGQLLRLVCELVLTTVGIIWLDPTGAWIAIAAAITCLTVPFMMQSRLAERDLRVRNHNGALSVFYLDALLGLTPIRAHGAEPAVRREHEGLLGEWMRASLSLLRAGVAIEMAQSLVGVGIVVWLLFDYMARGGETASVLLLVYWSLNLPALGQEVALIARQYPSARNITLRLFEPLGASEEITIASPSHKSHPMEDQRSSTLASGVAIVMENVAVRAAGHLILEDIDICIEPGSHVAIIGASGAGKSSFAGLLLGWHRVSGGHVLVDGQLLDTTHLIRLRQETAWVDPAIQIWNRSLWDNLIYGTGKNSAPSPGSLVDAAELRGLLEKLPEGWTTRLGEGGGLVSGGEGQRVRLGRAMMRNDARLVILDEPFRGLDREQRRALLARARQLWRKATLLCITHDVSETLGFDRVMVFDSGRIVEAGSPNDLASSPDSRYRNLLDAEKNVRLQFWGRDDWRRLTIVNGRLIEHRD